MLVGSKIGPFEIEKELGSGAMGTVYRAQFHREKDGKIVTVALKVIALGLLGNDSAMARFERESNILKQLKHPNIVRLIATGRYRQTPFIAMEYIDGEAMDVTLGRRVRFSWEEVVAFGRQLAAALQYAHEKGIIHRDLKPSNLMLTKHGTLKLTDFGIAKDTDVTALTGANSTIGTAAYMSPEQCKGDRNLTNKSDLYSLGIVFFELLTGRKPFMSDSTVDMFLKHVNEKPPKPSAFVSELPAKLESLVMQLIEKDKDHRPVDAAWVGRMLAEVEEDAFARKSAGLDAAYARRADRIPGQEKTYDEADREAARALKGKRRRAKREALRWFQRTPVKAAAIVAALLAIAGVAYIATRTPSAASLFAAIEKAKPEEKKEAVEKYLATYGQQTDEITEKVQAMFRDLAVRKRDEVLTNRFRKTMRNPEENDDADAYNLAWLAMEAERSGESKRAADYWTKVRDRFPEDANRRAPMSESELVKTQWVWIADKRLRDLKEAGDLSVQIPELLKRATLDERFPSYEPTDSKYLLNRGFRLESFGDRAKARKEWEALMVMTDKRLDQRPLYLLATQRRKQISDMKEEDAQRLRGELVAKALDEARQRTAAPPGDAVALRSARNNCRNVIDLYSDDRGFQAQVSEAKKILETLLKAN